MPILSNPFSLALLIIVLGDLLGRIRFRSFALGPAAIIFVALAFGHFGYRLPTELRNVGLAMFIYTVALQAGPGFLNSFRNHGLALSCCVLAVVATGALSAWFCGWLFDFSPGMTAGLMAGAMTSTPALAAAVDLLGPQETTAAYGVTYGFGVIGVALFIILLPRIARRSITAEEEALQSELDAANPPITFCHAEIVNEEAIGRSVQELNLRSIAPVTVTRLLRHGAAEPVLVRGDTLFAHGDRVRIAGRPDDLEKVVTFLGRPVSGEIAFERNLNKKSIIVSQHSIVGKTLGFFNIQAVFNVQVTRVTRNGIDIPPYPNLRLHLGDIVHAVGDERALTNLTRILGNDLKATYEIGLLPILVGLLIAFAIGGLTVPLPIVGPFHLGITGGALLAGLILGALYSTGPLIWDVPAAGSRLIRDLGLALFMAAVGTAAGGSLLATLREQGLLLVGAGMIVTIMPLAIGTIVGLRFFKIRFLRLLGTLVGSMTSASGLAAANAISATSYAAAAYATVYPVAMIAKIVAIKLLVMALL